MKKCNNCANHKPLSDFHRSSANNDGHCNTCKQCSSNYSRKRRTEKKEHIRELNRQHYQDNKEKVKANAAKRATEYRKQYCLLNPDTTTKPCKKCNNTMPLKCFSKRATAKDGRRTTCKTCSAEKKATYREANRTKLRESNRHWCENNKDKIKDNNRLFHANNPNYYRERWSSDPTYRLRKTISGGISASLAKRDSTKRGQKTFDFLPYTLEDLKQHLESQFDNKMTWDNYGSYWHVDHIYPQCRFTFETIGCEGFKMCWSLSNLRPLEATKNMKKSDKVTVTFKEVFGFDKPSVVL